MNEHKIIHDQDRQMFYIDLPDDQQAYLKYQLQADNQVDFISTHVPETHRKQGIAAYLIETGFAWADQQALNIVASCWYAARKLAERRSE